MDSRKPGIAGAMRGLIVILAVISMLCSPARAALQNPQTYWEMCDASAAVALDETHFAVADDEGNTLRVYKIGEPKPVREYEVGKFLVAQHKKAETDLEGAARVGDRI